MSLLEASVFSAKPGIPNPVKSQSPKPQPSNAGKRHKSLIFPLFPAALLNAMFAIPLTDAFAQKVELGIENLQAIKSGKSVLIRFTVPAGLSCDGIIIRRSVEGGDFLPIREIEGICGSDSASTTFSEEDELPVFNRRMQYLLQLGRHNYSDTLNAYFTETGPAEFLLTRQVEGWKILLNNSSGELLRLLAYDLRGSTVLSLETRSVYFEITEMSRFGGPMFFRLLNSKSGLMGSGKLPFTQ